MSKIKCPFCLDDDGNQYLTVMSIYGNVTVDIIKTYCPICLEFRFFDRRDMKVYKTLEEIKWWEKQHP